MHVPDGLMDPRVAAIGMIEFVSALALVIALGRRKLRDDGLPRLAVLSAGIFAAQMINFPIGGGTTGHLIGATLLAIIMGPGLAILGMTVVLLIQALMFGDGGLTSLGLNAVNMAIIAPLAGWGTYNLLTKRGHEGHSKIAVACGAWVSVFLAAAACAAELAVSYAISGGSYGIGATVAVPSMLGYHAVIGMGEAAITVGMVAYLDTVHPQMFGASGRMSSASDQPSAWQTARAALAIVVVFALILPLYIVYASEGKDGLEKTMSEGGVNEGAPVIRTPFSYGENYLQALLAGLLGFAAVGLAVAALSRLLRPEVSR